VPPDVYPDVLTRQIAQMLTSANAVRFDGSDQVPAAVNSAFYVGLQNFLFVFSDPQMLDVLSGTTCCG